MVNKAYMTISVVSFPPNVVAAACFDLAATQLKISSDDKWFASVGALEIKDVRFIQGEVIISQQKLESGFDI